MTSYRFGRCAINAKTRELSVSGIKRNVEPKVLDLIVQLIRHDGQVVTRDQLIESVWKGRIVTDSSISVAVNAARRVMGDSGKHQQIIKTIPKHGYLFVGDIETEPADVKPQPSLDETKAENSVVRKTSVSEQTPLVAVTLGVLRSDKGKQLAIAFVDDITTELSRFHLIRVLATQTSFGYGQAATDGGTLASQHHVDYIVTVSIGLNDKHCDIKITITDKAQNIVDSFNLSANLAELLPLRNDVVARVASTISHRISDEEIIKSRSRISNNPDAYTSLLHGLSIYKFGEVSLQKSREALQWFERTIELDQDCARAHAWLECCGADFAADATDPEYIKRSIARMEHAIELDPYDHEVHRVFGATYCISGEHDLGDYHLSKAVELNPNEARVLLRIGYYRSFIADHKDDLVYVNKAFELNPAKPSYYHHDRAVVNFNRRNYEKALADLRISSTDTLANDLYLVACLQALGQTEESDQLVAETKLKNPEIAPDSIKTIYPFACYGSNNKGHHLYGLLQQAGWF